MRRVTRLMFAVTATVLLAAASLRAQAPLAPLYRVFLTDGGTLTSYGEWSRADDLLVFSLPLTANTDSPPLHLVSIPIARVDLARTMRYADAVRGAQYAAVRGEADFAQFSADVTKALNDIGRISDPVQRLQTAERARTSLASWPALHYGYRAGEVRDLVRVLDDVIAALRGAAGLGFDLALSATTITPPTEPLLPPPSQEQLAEQLLTASALAATPVEKLSLLQTVVAFVDQAVGLLPDAIAARLRSTAIGSLAEEQRINASYAQLQTNMLAAAARYSAKADIRGLEALKAHLRDQDQELGNRRRDDVASLMHTIDAYLESARRIRLAHDRWVLRRGVFQAYQRTTSGAVQQFVRSSTSLDDIRLIAGPAPQRLQPLIENLAREKRRLSRIDPPEELSAVHSILRSACELAETAARLRLEAVLQADLRLAEQASSAAAGALLLFERARAELEAALKPPVLP